MASRARARSALRPALAAVGVGALAFGAVEIALVLHAGTADPLWAAVLFVGVALVYVGAGLLAWWRRSANRIGVLIVGGGAALLAGGLADTGVPALVAAGTAVGSLALAVVVHLLHAFPSGRVRGAVSRVTVAAGYVVCLPMEAPLYLFTPDPANPLAIADRPDLAAAGAAVQAATGTAVMVVTAGVLARRLRRAGAGQRRILAPVYGYGMAAVLFIPFSARVLMPLLHLSLGQRGAMQLVALCGIPVAFTLGVLRGGFARTGEVEELGAWLSRPDATRPRLASALARTLGDDSLVTFFWSRESAGYVDLDGAPAALPAPGTDRAAVEFDVDGVRVGAIVYDATLIADPEPVRAAGRVAAIALTHERLTAELRAHEEELRRSRLRIVEAGDRERRRIARNLHDGVQVRMVLLALAAQRGPAAVRGRGDGLLRGGRGARERAQARRRERGRGAPPRGRRAPRGGVRRRLRGRRSRPRLRPVGAGRPRGHPRRALHRGQRARPRHPTARGAAVRIVIGEDEALLRQGLTHVLEHAGHAVVGTAADAVELVRQAEERSPDLVITDIRMPPTHTDEGLVAALAISRSRPGTAIVVLSQHVQRRYATDLLGERPSGVGYLLKQRIADIPTFCADLERVRVGGTVLDPEVVGLMMAAARRHDRAVGELTPRQGEVLALMAQGRSNAAIARELSITEKAVVGHVSRIYDLLGLAHSDDDHRRVLAVLRYLAP